MEWYKLYHIVFIWHMSGNKVCNCLFVSLQLKEKCPLISRECQALFPLLEELEKQISAFYQTAEHAGHIITQQHNQEMCQVSTDHWEEKIIRPWSVVSVWRNSNDVTNNKWLSFVIPQEFNRKNKPGCICFNYRVIVWCVNWCFIHFSAGATNTAADL